jgi:hypothetical protein
VSLFSYPERPLYKILYVEGYNKIRTRIINELSKVPPHSLVVTYWDGEKQYFVFMRPDLSMVSLGWTPQSLSSGTLEHIASLVEKSKEAYVYVNWSLLGETAKEQLNSFIANYSNNPDTGEKVIRLK